MFDHSTQKPRFSGGYMQKITPFLWFENNAEEAMNFYVSIFPNSKIISVSKQSVQFQLEGQELMILNGGPHFKLSPAVSMFVNCETQKEIDRLYEQLLAGGGEPSRCGWLTDKYGLSWQLVPTKLGAWLQDKDPKAAKRVMEAMLKMGKLEIAVLQQAYEQQ
jgi:predicted 3-demethylubiquinone-9 3-methyltransferase (glyoxalase superfamily)